MPKVDHQVIWLHSQAPAKPDYGQACNGCGVCCSAEPCPVARVFLWQRRGACRALEWHTDAGAYRCGMLLRPAHYLYFIPVVLQTWFSRLVSRWIAANSFCDSTVEANAQTKLDKPELDQLEEDVL